MGHKRILEGVVVSAEMQKTVVVRVENVEMHPLYHKRMRTRKIYKVHDEKGQAKAGDRVRIVQTRHLSKDKYYTLVEVFDKAKEKDRAVVEELPAVLQVADDKKQTTENRRQRTKEDGQQIAEDRKGKSDPVI